MRGLEVRPLDGPPLERPAVTKPVPRKRHRGPLLEEEVVQAVAPEEASLFLEAMSDLGMNDREASGSKADPPAATPPDRPRPARASNPISTQEQALFLEAVARLDHVVDKDQAMPPSSAGSAASARSAASASGQTRRKPQRVAPARKAAIKIDATLDLHRERQDAALERLRTFLVQSAIHRLATVLVITGKGNHSEDGQGVLRRAVEAWLNQHGAPWVARYGEAPRHHGGSGAWLLTLRQEHEPRG
jgi:DNA-nicking Smr family endonuclease